MLGGWGGGRRLSGLGGILEPSFLRSLDLWLCDVLPHPRGWLLSLMQKVLLFSSQRLGFSIVVFRSRGACQLDC